MEWYLKAFRQYADFKGRARRKEYWMFTLFNMIFIMVGAAIMFTITDLLGDYMGMFATFAILFIYMIIIIIPALAVTARRLHDTGKSGWFILLYLIPFGGMVLFIFMCIDSDYGENKWGPNPKDIGNNTEIDQIGVS